MRELSVKAAPMIHVLQILILIKNSGTIWMPLLGESTALISIETLPFTQISQTRIQVNYIYNLDLGVKKHS